jgi:hypothetical protein
MEKNTGLSAPEAFILMSLPRCDSRKALKLGFMGLLAQGVLRAENEAREGIFRTRHVTHLWVAPNLPDDLPPLTASLVGIVRSAELRDGVMAEIVRQSMREYGNNLLGFANRLVCPALAVRGFAERRKVRLLGLIPIQRFERTPAGDVEKARLENVMREARSIPRYLDSDPAQVAALVAAVGGAIFLIDELQPHYQNIAKTMRAQSEGGDGGGGDGGSSGGDNYFDSNAGSSHAGGGFESGHFDSGGFDASSFNFDGIDFGSFDFGSFDSGFDGGGGDGGDGGDGGGDGGGC